MSLADEVMEAVDQSAIKSALLRNEITWQQALKAITSSPGKPWHKKEWKEKRAALIKDYCEQCGKTESPFVLQHLQQPQPFKQLLDGLYVPQFNEQYEKWKSTRTELQPTPVDRPACPKCGSTNIYTRKTGVTKWKCNSTAGPRPKRFGMKRPCGFEFDNPATVKAPSPEQKREVVAHIHAQYEAFRQQFIQQHYDRIATQAVLLSIEQHLRYATLEDTKTYCKKCAYMWDERGCKLCDVCREGYHPFHMSKCYKCDTENYKLCSQCRERYHSVRYEVCYTCSNTGN